jgi:hypothetical protein
VVALAAAMTAACIDLTLAQPEPHPLASSTATAPVMLGAGPTRVPLAAVRDPREITPEQPLAARLRAAAAGQQVYLNLQAMATENAPGVSYNVYLNLPQGQAPQGVEDSHYLGTMNFFNAQSGRPGQVALNITEALQRLLRRGDVGTDEMTLTIVPAGAPDPAAKPQIGKFLIVAR